MAWLHRISNGTFVIESGTNIINGIEFPYSRWRLVYKDSQYANAVDKVLTNEVYAQLISEADECMQAVIAKEKSS